MGLLERWPEKTHGCGKKNTAMSDKMARTSVRGFPGGSAVKKPPANAADGASVPGQGRSPGEGNGNSLQYSCLGNPVDRGAWRATDYGGHKELETT